MPLPDHTSASQLSCYAMCPRKYEYRYVHLVEPEYKSVSLALGSRVRTAREAIRSAGRVFSGRARPDDYCEFL